MEFKKIAPNEIDGVFDRIGKDWMLVSAAKDGKVNTMTASWGCMGVLWNKPVFIIFIRPQRYTFEFIEASEKVTLSFFDESMRQALKICGAKSGRDCDKIKEAGLSAIGEDTDTPYFAEACLVLKGKKLYADYLREDCFLSEEALNHYKAKDYHKFYVYELTEALASEK